jgi:dTDP-4-dehydrorhamnose 3,5-epimerase
MPIKIIKTNIPEVLLIEPEIFYDDRGFFFESFNLNLFNKATELNVNFVQDNHSKSIKGVLRGMHYQINNPQGKLVRVIEGEIFDVAVDIRPESKNFGKWVGFIISKENKKQLWIPPGFAHGFQCTSDEAEVLYKTTEYYCPASEKSIHWNDPNINIDWPIKVPILSSKDSKAKPLVNVLEL